MSTRGISRESSQHMKKYCASLNLRRAARVVTRHYDQALRKAGITATQLPLLAAINAGVSTSISSLGKELDLERSTVSRELDVLERRALIKSSEGFDRRATTLSLTARGHKTLAAAFAAWQEAHDAVTSAYGSEAFDALLAQTKVLGQTVKGLGSATVGRRPRS
jgi:DNA-binding MarR family transcriptional regulator